MNPIILNELANLEGHCPHFDRPDLWYLKSYSSS